MRDERSTGSRLQVGVSTGSHWLIFSVALVGIGALAVGALVVGAGDGGAVDADAEDDDGIEVTADCEDETNVVVYENQYDDPVDVTLTWTTDQTAMSVQSDVSTQLHTESSVEATAAGMDETSKQSLTTGVPANESVTLAGLPDDSYELSVSADAVDAEVNQSALTLECGTDADAETQIVATTEDEHLEYGK